MVDYIFRYNNVLKIIFFMFKIFNREKLLKFFDENISSIKFVLKDEYSFGI